MGLRHLLVLAATAGFVPSLANAQDVQSSSNAPSVPFDSDAIQANDRGLLPRCASGVVPALTSVWFETMQAVGSRISQPGQWFELRVAKPVFLSGYIAIPAGAIAKAEVTYADPATKAGDGGAFFAVARYLSIKDIRIRLRNLSIKTGAPNTPLRDIAKCMFMSCSYRIYDIEYPQGSLLEAKIAEPFDVSLVNEPID